MGDSNLQNEQMINDLFDACSGGEMTNGAAIGYMIMAAKDLEIPTETIRDIQHLMLDKMDFYPEEQAEREYRYFG